MKYGFRFGIVLYWMISRLGCIPNQPSKSMMTMKYIEHLGKLGMGGPPKIKASPPVLLFPGMGASRLMRGNDDVYPPSIHTYVTNYQQWKRDIIENKELTVMPFGDKHALDLPILTYFSNNNIYKTLLKEPDVYPMPYDFRRIDDAAYIQELFPRIRAYVERFNEPVIFMCHSSGGLLAHWFLHQQTAAWRRQWMNSVVHINVPFAGVVTVLENSVCEHTRINRYIGRTIFNSLGATVWNLPDMRHINHTVLKVDDVAVNDYFWFFKMTDLHRRWKLNLPVIDSFKAPVDDVDTHILYCTTQGKPSTPYTLAVSTREDHHDEPPIFLKEPSSRYKIHTIMGAGDSVVTLNSLLIPQKWGMPPEKLTFHHVENSGHSTIVKRLRYPDYLG